MSEQHIIHAASTAVFKDEKLLIVKRGKGANKDLWSFPGGHIKSEESPSEAAAREIIEETGVRAELLSHLQEITIKVDTTKEYRLQVYVGRWIEGEARAGSDAKAVKWIDLQDLVALDTTPDLHSIALKAWKQLTDHP